MTEAVAFRRATRDDLDRIVHLLADDRFGATREDLEGWRARYERAFEEIDADSANLLIVGCQSGRVVATMQLTFIPYLALGATKRCLVEAVRVDSSLRGSGIGEAMFGWAVAEAKRRGCGLVQLTTDKRRVDARRFYERLGFVASHDGMKLLLTSEADSAN